MIILKLSNDEIQDLLFCIDLIIQYHGENERLDKLYNKLLSYKKEPNK